MIAHLLVPALWTETMEKAVDYWTFWLAAATAILAFSTVALWLVTLRMFRHARRTTEKQLRAYIGIKTTTLEHYRAGSKAVARVEFIMNAGLTPANNVMTAIFIDFLPPATDDKSLEVDFSYAVSRSTLAKDRTLNLDIDSLAPMTEAEFSEIVSGKLRIFIFGKVRYEDIFGAKWKTPFRLHNHAKGHKDTKELNLAGSGNAAT